MLLLRESDTNTCGKTALRGAGKRYDTSMYIERSVDPLIDDLLRELPALLLVGPRATGKTTTAQRHAAAIIRLDHPAEAAAFEADPDAALRDLPEPVVIDEWQVVPGVLGAIKRAVDTASRPGRFIVTGSVNADLQASTWPGTGRLVRIPLFGLTVAERRGRARHRPLLDRIVDGRDLEPAADTPDLRGYVDLALESGFPEAALTLSGERRRRWLESYIEQLVTRDAPEIASRDPVRLRRYLHAYVLNSAGVPDDRTIYGVAGIDRRTAHAYERLLTNLFAVEATPAWTSNRLKRLALSPKRYVIEAALLCASVGVDAMGVMRDGDLMGRVLDTFVASQIRAEIASTACRPRLYHLRQEQGRHEIDVIAEIGVGSVIAIEVKSTAAPRRDDAVHLAWLRDRLADRFTAGVVLHTGPRTFTLDDRIVAAPISTLWA